MEGQRKSSQARIDVNNRYDKKAYDRALFRIRRDGKINLDTIRTHAETMGESLNGFLMRAVEEAIERDKQRLTE